jgi:transaldolase/glucose-6-phosphate isomerase
VSPLIAHETEPTISDAKRLFAALDRPNAMIKIPGTAEGLPAVEHCLAEGLNINITLLFGVENYEQVALAYLKALEKRMEAGQPIDRIGSVASFFVSRVDTLVDSRLEERIQAAESELERERLGALKGKAGVANAKIAYARYQELFSGSRWEALAAKGARVQRCLWASTSTKNPDYRDVLYAEELIGPDTVNTMPQSTLDAFREHGIVAATLTQGVDEAQAHIRELENVGIDFRAVTDELQVQGVKLFADSYEKARATVEEKRDRILAEKKRIGAASRGD